METNTQADSIEQKMAALQLGSGRQPSPLFPLADSTTLEEWLADTHAPLPPSKDTEGTFDDSFVRNARMRRQLLRQSRAQARERARATTTVSLADNNDNASDIQRQKLDVSESSTPASLVSILTYPIVALSGAYALAFSPACSEPTAAAATIANPTAAVAADANPSAGPAPVPAPAPAPGKQYLAQTEVTQGPPPYSTLAHAVAKVHPGPVCSPAVETAREPATCTVSAHPPGDGNSGANDDVVPTCGATESDDSTFVVVPPCYVAAPADSAPNLAPFTRTTPGTDGGSNTPVFPRL